MKSIGLKRITAALALASFATAAVAQYVWLDEKGTKQFSDMPPPASVSNPLDPVTLANGSAERRLMILCSVIRDRGKERDEQ